MFASNGRERLQCDHFVVLLTAHFFFFFELEFVHLVFFVLCFCNSTCSREHFYHIVVLRFFFCFLCFILIFPYFTRSATFTCNFLSSKKAIFPPLKEFPSQALNLILRVTYVVHWVCNARQPVAKSAVSILLRARSLFIPHRCMIICCANTRWPDCIRKHIQCTGPNLFGMLKSSANDRNRILSRRYGRSVLGVYLKASIPQAGTHIENYLAGYGSEHKQSTAQSTIANYILHSIHHDSPNKICTSFVFCSRCVSVLLYSSCMQCVRLKRPI